MSEQREFVTQFHSVIDELDRNGRSDNETMWLLGSLAARLVKEAKADNWTDLKLRIGPTSLEELVQTLDSQAAGYQSEGRTKPAYVARLLGISLVASRIPDPATRQRDQLLNNFIDTAAIVFIENHNAAAATRP
ncbi:MAG: hypothetical protein ABI398_05530 [Devosia sp.]